MSLQLLAALIPVGAALFGPAISAKFGATGETASKLVGGKTDPSTLVGSFLEMRGMVDSKGKATLTPRESIEIPRARSVQELTRGSPRGVNLAATSPVQRILQSDSRLEEAALRMMTQSTNSEMNRFVDKYAPQRTIPQGRKTVAAPQPRDIDVRLG
jgi:hypothetical protein